MKFRFLRLENSFQLVCALSAGLVFAGGLIVSRSCAWAAGDDAVEIARDAYNRGDYETALEFWRVLAADGSPSAQFNLGRLYAAGLGVSQSFKQSFHWYMKAANQNDADAQQMVGAMYGAGLGVGQSPVDAYMWFLLSARSGSGRPNRVSIRDLLLDLEEVMAQQGTVITESQREDARLRAISWRPEFR